MRHLRAKSIRKALKQYQFLCGIKAPYKVLLDGNFIAMCTQMHVDIRERLPKFLQVKPHECELYVPAAALKELELLGDVTKEAYMLAKSFKVVDAEQTEEKNEEVDDADKPSSSNDVSENIKTIIGDSNSRRFFVATQEVELRKALRLVPGVPMIYLNRSILVFEDISKATLAIVRQKEKTQRSNLDSQESRQLSKLESKEEEESDDGEKHLKKFRGSDITKVQVPQRKRKRAAGPNPLAMRKPSKKKVRAKKRKTESN